jgi:hypothetical protein
MSQKTISNSAVAIYLSRAELSAQGITGTAITGSVARRLVREALLAGGETPWDDMELELFAAEDSLLLLARPGSFKLHCFRFFDFDALTDAALACPFDLPSAVTYLDGAFYLFVRAGDADVPSAMFEFGEAAHCPDGFFTYACEHGERIIPRGAIAVLREKFA